MTKPNAILLITDELEGDPSVPFDLRPIGDQWSSDAHVLIVMAGDGDGPEYGVAHPTGCTDECGVLFQLVEGGFTQPSDYPQVPTEPGLHLMRATTIKGGWLTADYPVDHDCFLTFDDQLVETTVESEEVAS